MSDILLKAMLQKTQNEESLFKGFVLDGFLSNTSGMDDTVMPPDMQALSDLIDKKSPNQIFVLVNLSISDENLIRRRAAQWLDPKTNTFYSGQQVAYSRKRRADGWIDGTPDEFALAEAKLEDASDAKENQAEGQNEENIEGEKENGEQEGKEEEVGDGIKPQRVDRLAMKLSNRSTWPILSEEILNR